MGKPINNYLENVNGYLCILIYIKNNFNFRNDFV